VYHAGGNTASGVHGPTLTVLPDALPAGGSITVNLNMSLFDAEVIVLSVVVAVVKA
jgi:hypothetical protein